MTYEVNHYSEGSAGGGANGVGSGVGSGSGGVGSGVGGVVVAGSDVEVSVISGSVCPDSSGVGDIGSGSGGVVVAVSGGGVVPVTSDDEVGVGSPACAESSDEAGRYTSTMRVASVALSSLSTAR